MIDNIAGIEIRFNKEGNVVVSLEENVK